MDRRKLLKIKLKSLAEEAHIIRFEERRSQGVIREEMHRHRVIELRNEARAAHIAYGLIRGKTLEQIEGRKPDDEGYRVPKWDRVEAMVKKYGGTGMRKLTVSHFTNNEHLDAYKSQIEKYEAAVA